MASESNNDTLSTPQQRRSANRIVPPGRAWDALKRTESVFMAERSMRLERRACLRQVSKARTRAELEGYEDGLALANAKALCLVQAAEQVYRDAEPRLIGLVIAVVEKIAGDIPPNLILPGLIRTALRDLNEPASRITIEVHPAVLDAVGELAKAWQAEAGAAATLDVAGNETLDVLDCRLDCGGSVVEAGLNTQLRTLHKALLATGTSQ